MLDLTSRILRGFANYGNPLGLLAQRTLKRPLLRVVDRKTGIRCDCNRGADRMFGEIFHNREYDVPKRPIRPGDVVIDIGANHGFFALYAARRGARVFAFEPTPEIFAIFERNIRLNNLEDQITARPWAIGAEDGEIELICSDNLGGGQNTTTPVFARNTAISVSRRHTVPCRSLGSVLDEFALDHVDLCKLDCEGGELVILRSLSRDDMGRVGSIVMEYHTASYDLGDVLSLFLDHGTHQVSFAEEKDTGNAILRAVSPEVLKTIAAAISGR